MKTFWELLEEYDTASIRQQGSGIMQGSADLIWKKHYPAIWRMENQSMRNRPVLAHRCRSNKRRRGRKHQPPRVPPCATLCRLLWGWTGS